MSRIDLNVVATGNFGQLEGQLARLKAQVAGLNASMSSGMMINPAAIAGMQNYANLMADNLRSTGMFQTKMVSLTSETERFGQSLQRGNIRLGDYFRTATGHIRNQQTEIQRLAREQVRLMNSTSLAMGDGRAMVITPTGIDEAIHKQQILNQEYRIFRQVVQGGSTQLINWGKNTQWAGRQLTVGLTVPLTIFGAAAAKTFMEADKQLTRLTKVYGDAAKGVVSPGELQSIRQQTLGLAKDIASSMGVAAEETLGIAADIAATGKEGNELLSATSEAMRLSVLGEVDRQEAMRATLSIQSVFKKDTEGLAESINFLNAVENETSASIDDLVTGIVKAGPVVQGLGGDIEDLALMMVAMREGGIPASEAANAIKSSLASLINPTKQTTQTLNAFGVDLISIVDKNAGDVIGTLVDLQTELSTLDELSRQRAIEQIFGKFQFSRINALLNNLGKAGSQTQEVLKLAGLSVEDLAANADQELKAVTDSVSGRFQRAFESLKANLIPIGEVFTKVGTMILEVGNKILEIFNSLPDPVKNFVQGLMFLTGLAGPIIMITGVFGNFLGYLLKGVSSLMAIKQAGRGVFEYFTPESVAARNASELITQAFYDEEQAIHILNRALEQLNKTLIEMKTNSNAAVGSMQELASGTMAAAEAGAIESSYHRRTGPGKSAGMAGGVFSHRSSKAAMTEAEAGLVAGTGSLLPADFIRATTINTIIKEDVVPIIAEGANQASIELVEGLRNKLNEGLRGGLRPDEEARVFQTKEAYLGETAGQVAYPAVMATAASQGVASADIIQAQTQFADDIVTSGIETAMSNLKTSMAKMGVDLGLEVDKIHTDLAEIFEKSMRDTGGDVVASMEEVRRAAQGMEEKAKQVLADANVPMKFATGADVKSGEGMSKKVSTASQLAMGEYFGLKPEVISNMDAAARARLEAMKLATEADKKIAETSSTLQRKTQEEIAQKNKSIKNMKVRDAYVVGEGKQARTYALIGNKWYAVTANRVRILDASNKSDAALITTLSQRNKAESDKARSSRMAAQADIDEAKSSNMASQADREEAKGSRMAAMADGQEALGGAAGGRGLRGRLAGGAGLGALGALSMATTMIPAEEGSAMAQGMDVVGGVGMGASMGAMVGSVVPGIGTAIGAAVGGVLGGIGPVVSIFSDNAEKAANAVEALRISSELAAGALGSIEQNFLGIDIKELEDIPLEAFGEKTAEAQSQLDQFKDSLQAAKDAEEASTEKQRISEISAMSSADELINSQMFQSMLSQAIMGGASKDQIALMMEGYLDVADKEYFSKRVVEYLDSVIPEDASAAELSAKFINGLTTAANKITEGMSDEVDLFLSEQRDYESMRAGRGITVEGRDGAQDFSQVIGGLQGSLAQDPRSAELLSSMMQQYNAGDITSQGFVDQIIAGSASEGAGSALADYLGGIQINGESILEADPEFLMQILSALQQITYLTPDVSTLSGEVNKFNESTKATAESLISLTANTGLKEFRNTVDEIDFSKIDTQSLIEVESQLRNIPEVGPELADFFGGMIRDGVDSETAFKALKLAMSGTVTDLDILTSKARDPIRFEVYYDTFVTGPGGPAGYTPTGLTGELPMPGVSDLVSAATQSGGGGGGSDTSAIEGIYDKQIEKQDKLIEKIKEEREERQKLYDLEKQAFDFAMKEQDLKNQIARARAEGRTAEAAMLQAQLDNTREAEKQQEAERRRQEQEDRRIEKAERTKEKLQAAKERATDQGGGGGGGGLSDEEVKRIEQRAKFLETELGSALEKFSIDIEKNILDKGLSGFFDSAPVVKFREEMVKLGVPVEQVNEYLDTIFDGFIENTNLVTTNEFKNIKSGLEDIGFEGETLQDVIGNTFAILQDDELTKTEQIDLIADAFYEAGMDAGEAETAARKFYDEVGRKSNVTSNIDAITSAWKRAGDSAKRTALLQALANDVAQGNLSADVVAGRLSQIDIMAPPMATGGYIVGPGTSTSDSIPVRLSNGEYVIRANMVDKYGVPFFDALNKGVLPMMAGGGMVSRYPSVAAGMARGGYVRTGYNMGGLVSGKESEYNINVYVTESNASADDIASKVMQSLQRRDKMNRAGIRI